jgi:hypothetical protein
MERERDGVIAVNGLTKRFGLPSFSTYQTRAAL